MRTSLRHHGLLVPVLLSSAILCSLLSLFWGHQWGITVTTHTAATTDGSVKEEKHSRKPATRVLAGKGSRHIPKERRKAKKAVKLAARPCGPTLSHTIISQVNITYCYPKTLAAAPPSHVTKQNEQKKPLVMVVGVLTTPKNRKGRDLIRRTWAKFFEDNEEDNINVYFLVSGPWSDIAEEFHSQGDLLWMDGEEDYRRVTYKVHILFHAVHTHAQTYDYILKTDDDSYLHLHRIRSILANTDPKPHYWGRCARNKPVIRLKGHRWAVSKKAYKPDIYPTYALGAGYAVSREFNTCIVKTLPTFSFMPNEDAGIGIIANDFCGGFNCTSHYGVKPVNLNTAFVSGVQYTEDMAFLHRLHGKQT